MSTNILDEISKILNGIERYWINEKLAKQVIIDDLRNNNTKLISKLLSNQTVNETYVQDIDGYKIFDKESFISMLRFKNYLPNNYTKYSNEIGLTSEGKYLNYNTDVVLDFPHKDSILEGGMAKEDVGKDEIFYHNVLAKEEIDTLLAPKVLNNIKKYDENGEHEVTEFNDDDNLLIKGDNLLALHTIKGRFKNYFDVIYIDPPYNVPSSNNTFAYNNNFNHSSWLIFMKNRLEIAKELMKEEDGVLIIAIDENEVNYLGVLLDELFNQNYEKHLITVVHNPRGVQGTNFSYSNDFMYFVFPEGKKLIQNRILQDEEIKFSNLRNWGGESLRSDGKNTFYPIIVDKTTEEIVDFGDIVDEDIHPKQTEMQGDKAYVYPIDSKGTERKWRYARNTVEGIKDMLKVSKKNNSRYEVLFGKNFGQYKTVWTSPRYDASVHGKQLLKKLVPDTRFTFPKSVYTVYDALHAVIQNRQKAKVLDFFSGSGTTAHAVQMLNQDDNGNRNYVMIEQMSYIKDTQIPRLLAVDENKQNDSFIYAELAKENQEIVESIITCNTKEELSQQIDKLLNEGVLNYEVDFEKFTNTKKEFNELELEDQKEVLIRILDNNQLYVNYSDMEDSAYNFTEDEIAFNHSFYGGE